MFLVLLYELYDKGINFFPVTDSGVCEKPHTDSIYYGALWKIVQCALCAWYIVIYMKIMKAIKECQCSRCGCSIGEGEEHFTEDMGFLKSLIMSPLRSCKGCHKG